MVFALSLAAWGCVGSSFSKFSAAINPCELREFGRLGLGLSGLVTVGLNPEFIDSGVVYAVDDLPLTGCE